MNPFMVFIVIQVAAYSAAKLFVADKNKRTKITPATDEMAASDSKPTKEDGDNVENTNDQPGGRDSGNRPGSLRGPGIEESREAVSDETPTASGDNSGEIDGGGIGNNPLPGDSVPE